MIRKPQAAEIRAVAELWLDTNLKAHGFIPAQYWRDHYASVMGLLAQAEVYVCPEDGKIQGFIGLQGDEIAGIFVRSEAQSCGIGKRLLDFAKGLRDQLTLHVYQKNPRAKRFYEREGFSVLREETDGNTGEREYVMRWSHS